jgi:hypothetical protein
MATSGILDSLLPFFHPSVVIPASWASESYDDGYIHRDLNPRQDFARVSAASAIHTDFIVLGGHGRERRHYKELQDILSILISRFYSRAKSLDSSPPRPGGRHPCKALKPHRLLKAIPLGPASHNRISEEASLERAAAIWRAAGLQEGDGGDGRAPFSPATPSRKKMLDCQTYMTYGQLRPWVKE